MAAELTSCFNGVNGVVEKWTTICVLRLGWKFEDGTTAEEEEEGKWREEGRWRRNVCHRLRFSYCISINFYDLLFKCARLKGDQNEP